MLNNSLRLSSSVCEYVQLMKSLFICFLLTLLIVFHSTPAFAKDFDAFLVKWNEKKELASQYRLAAEKALKEGDKNLGGANNKKQVNMELPPLNH